MARVTKQQVQGELEALRHNYDILRQQNTLLREDVARLRAPCEPTRQASLPIDRPGDPCGRCGGTGQYGHHGKCYLCDGSGKFPGKKTAAVNFAKRRADCDARPVSDRRAAMDAAKAEAQRTGRSVAVR